MVRVRLDYCQHALAALVEADADETERVVAAIPVEQRGEITYASDFIRAMSVHEALLRWVNQVCATGARESG